MPRSELFRAAMAVLIGTALLRLAGGVALSSLGLYLKSLGSQGAEVAFVAAGYYIAELLLAPVFGALSDRVGRKIFLVAAPFLGAVALLLYPLSSSLLILFLIRLIEGVSAGAAAPATLGYLSDLTDGSKYRGRIMAFFEIATLFGLLIGGTVLGPRVWDAFHTSSYPILAGLYLLGAMVFWFFLPNVGLRVQHRRKFGDYSRVLSSKRLLRFMPAWIAATGVIGLWLVHVQNQLYAGKNSSIEGQALVGSLDGAGISLVLGTFGAVFLAGLYYGSRSTERRSTPMLYAGFGLLWLSICMFILNHPEWGLEFGFKLNLGFSEIYARGWFLLLLIGAFFQAGFTPVALAYLADISQDFPEDRGVVVGLYSIFLAGGNLIGGSLLGSFFVERFNFDGIALLTLLFTLVAFASVTVIRRNSSD
jgi:MFS family permease